MLSFVSPPRYPTASNQAKDPMVSAARTILNTFPQHLRASFGSCTSRTNEESCLEKREKTPLLDVKTGSQSTQKYGSLLKRKHARKDELKQSISRPILQFSDCDLIQQHLTQDGCFEHVETSTSSVYSSPTWDSRFQAESDRVDAFEYDNHDSGKGREERCSIQSFTSSNREYTFF